MSIQSQLAMLVMNLTRSNRKWVNPTKFHQFLSNVEIEGVKPFELTKNVCPFKDVHMENYSKLPTIVMSPPERKSNDLIIYFHGGAYVHQPNRFHFSFLNEILTQTNMTVMMPVYPKAPFFCAKDTYELIEEFYQSIIEQKQYENIYFMGDSAGGGLALGFAQMLLNRNAKMPKQLILLSPWVDVSMSHPEIQSYARKDPLLGIYGLKKIGKLWAGEWSVLDPRVSPLRGEFKGLPSIYVVGGTHELFVPDLRMLHSLIKDSGVDLVYEEYEGMHHVFPLINYPESIVVRKKIVEFITSSHET